MIFRRDALLGCVLILSIACRLAGAADEGLQGFVTPDQAKTTTIAAPQPGQAQQQGRVGYLGVSVREAEGIVLVEAVAKGSPAEQAGIKPGDEVAMIEGQAVKSREDFRRAVLGRNEGQTLSLALKRKGQSVAAKATLAAASKPMKLASTPVFLGARFGSGAELDGVPIDAIARDGPAARARLRPGDLILKIDNAPFQDAAMIDELLQHKKPGDKISLLIRRGDEEKTYTLKLDEDRSASRDPSALPRRIFNKPVYKLAIIGIEYPDVKHNEKITIADWTESIFSRDTYHDKNNATGQSVYGSMNDYYHDLSNGALKIEGKMFDWIQVSKNRGDYSLGTGTGAGTGNRTAVLTEAMELLVARERPGTLRDYDGIFFFYAGERFKTTRGGIYWPHRSSVTWKGARIPYLIVPEGGSKMGNISVMTHEFGHMLGLPDQYARPELPGSEGAGQWCVMSGQVGNGRPQHFCSWCKEQLGWLKPTLIDPAVPQKLILNPIETGSHDCYKVLMRPDGSEYLLLENRRKIGWDAQLAAEGLLIWRVVAGKPLLEEAHGIEGPAGPNVFRAQIPYPSTANNSYTPFTTPSSRPQLGGGAPVHITNIRQLPDGRISFQIGYEFN